MCLAQHCVKLDHLNQVENEKKTKEYYAGRSNLPPSWFREKPTPLAVSPLTD